MQRHSLGGGVGVAGTILSCCAHAEVASAPASAVSASQIGQLILSLFVVLALIAACAYVLRRLPLMRSPRNASMKIVEALPLSARDRLVLLDINGARLLIGVTAGSMTCLHSMATPGAKAEGSREFSTHLHASMADQPAESGTDTSTKRSTGAQT